MLSIWKRAVPTACVFACFLGASAVASARSLPETGPPPVVEAPRPALLSANFMISMAMEVSVKAYSGNIAEIYDNASQIMKSRETRQQFISRTQIKISNSSNHETLDWVSLQRLLINTQDAGSAMMPAGEYITIQLVRLSKDGQIVRETISFVLDDDKQWRLSGYVIG